MNRIEDEDGFTPAEALDQLYAAQESQEPQFDPTDPDVPPELEYFDIDPRIEEWDPSVRMPEHQYDRLTLHAHFGEPGYDWTDTSWKYREGLDPSAFITWMHQFTVVSVLKEYLIFAIQRGDLVLDSRHPRASRAAVLINFDTHESRTVNFNPGEHHEDSLPVVNVDDAAMIIDLVMLQEKRSLTQTWLHEKRTRANWQAPEQFSAQQIALASVFQLTEMAFGVPLEEAFPDANHFLAWLIETKGDNVETVLAPTEEDDIPF